MYNIQQQHNANLVPIRESSMIVEDYPGSVSDIRILRTHSTLPMITFKIGSTAFKALGELATTIQNVEGKHIEVSARKGSFQGVTEYAVKTLKAIEGRAVNLRDIDRFGKQPVQATPKSASDNRPEKPAMKVKDNYVVITIPQGVTPEQLKRITDVASQALEGLETQVGRGIFELAGVRVTESDPTDETGDVPF